MRVVFVNRYFYPDLSATSQMLSDLAFALAAAGEDVHVVTSRLSYNDPMPRLPADECIRGVTVHRIWTSGFGRKRIAGRLIDYLTFYPIAFLVLLRLLRRGDIAVAKTDPPLISIPTWFAVFLRGAVLINWVQDLFPDAPAALGMRVFQGAFGRFLARLRDRTFKSAAYNVAIGRRMASVIRARGVMDKQIVVVPNWADGSEIRPLPAEANPLRQEWNLVGKFIVGYSGNLGRSHEFYTIIKAAEQLRDDHRILFLFIGNGHAQARLRAEVAQRGLANFLFKPYQPRENLGISLTLPDVHLVSLLPVLEGFVVPSKFYGIAAAGRPVAFIGTVDGELAEEVVRFQCGAVVSPSDSDGLATFIRTLRDDAALRTEMGQRIRSAFEGNYSIGSAILTWRGLIGLIGRESRHY